MKDLNSYGNTPPNVTPPQHLQRYQLTPQRKVHLLTGIICLLNCGATYVKLFKRLELISLQSGNNEPKHPHLSSAQIVPVCLWLQSFSLCFDELRYLLTDYKSTILTSVLRLSMRTPLTSTPWQTTCTETWWLIARTSVSSSGKGRVVLHGGLKIASPWEWSECVHVVVASLGGTLEQLSPHHSVQLTAWF